MAKINTRYVPVEDRVRINPEDLGNRNYDYIPNNISSASIEAAGVAQDVMLGYYQQLGSGKATGEDKYNATVALSIMTGKPVSQVASNFDYYMSMYGGVDNSKGFWQAFGDKWQQYYMQRSISNLQNRFDGTNDPEEREELLQKIEQAEKKAISLEDPNTRDFFRNALVDFAPIAAQGVEAGLITGATALLASAFAPALVAAAPILNTTGNVIKGASAVTNFMSVFSLERGSFSRELYQAAQAEGIELDDNLRKEAADVIGGINAIIEIATLDPVTKYLGLPRATTKKIMKDSLSDVLKNWLKNNAKAAVSEGSEEFFQQLVSYWGAEIVKKVHNDKGGDQFDMGVMEEKIDESLRDAGEAFVSVLAPTFIGGGLVDIAKEIGKYGGRQTVDMVNLKTTRKKAEAEGYDVAGKTPAKTDSITSNVTYQDYAFKKAEADIVSEARDKAQKEKQQAQGITQQTAQNTQTETTKTEKKQLRTVEVEVTDDGRIVPANVSAEIELQKARILNEKFVDFKDITKDENIKKSNAQKADYVMKDAVENSIEDNRGILKDDNTIEFQTLEDKYAFLETFQNDAEAISDTEISIKQDDGVIHNYKMDVTNTEIDIESLNFSQAELDGIDYVAGELKDYFSRSRDENRALGAFVTLLAKSHGLTAKEFFDSYIQGIKYDEDLLENGKVEFGKDMKALITAGKSATPETFEHEVMHVVAGIGKHQEEFTLLFRKVRNDKKFKKFVEHSKNITAYKFNELDKAFKDYGKWTENDYEFFNQLYAAYRAENRHENKTVGNFFNKITGWFKSIYQSLKNTYSLNKDIVRYYDSLFAGDGRFKNTTIVKRDHALTLYEVQQEKAESEARKEKYSWMDRAKRNLGKNGKFKTMSTADIESLVVNKVFVPMSVLIDHKDNSEIVRHEIQERSWIKNIVEAHPEYKELANKAKSAEEFIISIGKDISENTKTLLERYYEYSKVRTPNEIMNDFMDKYLSGDGHKLVELRQALLNNETVRKKDDGSFVRVRYQAGNPIIREMPYIDGKSSSVEIAEAEGWVLENQKKVLMALLKAQLNLERIDYLQGKDEGFLRTSAEIAYMSMSDSEFDELKIYRDADRSERANANSMAEISDLRANFEKILSEQQLKKLQEERDIEKASYCHDLAAAVIAFAEEYHEETQKQADARVEAVKAWQEIKLELLKENTEKDIKEISDTCELIIDEYFWDKKKAEEEAKSANKELKKTQTALKNEQEAREKLQKKYDGSMWYNKVMRDAQHKARVKNLVEMIQYYKDEIKATKQQARKDVSLAKQQANYDIREAEKKIRKDLQYEHKWKENLTYQEHRAEINQLKQDHKDDIKDLRAYYNALQKAKLQDAKNRYNEKVKKINERAYSQALDRKIKGKLTMNNTVHHVSLLSTLTYIRDLVNNNQFKYNQGEMSDSEFAKVKLFKGTDDGELLNLSYTNFYDSGTSYVDNHVTAELNTGENKFNIKNIPSQLRNLLNQETIDYLTQGGQDSALDTKWKAAPIKIKEDILRALNVAKKEAKDQLTQIKDFRKGQRISEANEIVDHAFNTDLTQDPEVVKAWKQYHNTTADPTQAQLLSYYVQNYKRFNKVEDLSARKKIMAAVGGAIAHVQGVCLMIGGSENSAIYKAFVTDVQPHLDEFYRQKQRRLREVDNVLSKYTKPKSDTLEWLKGSHDVEMHEGATGTRTEQLTGFQLLGSYIYSKNIYGYIKLLASSGNNISLETLAKINPTMTMDFIDLEISNWNPKRATSQYSTIQYMSAQDIADLRVLFKDYSKAELQNVYNNLEAQKNKGSFEKIIPSWVETMGDEMIALLEKETPRLRDVAIRDFNSAFFEQANYFPLINANGGNTDVAIGKAFSNSNSIYNGMLKTRKLTEGYALLLDPISVLYSAIDSQERLINLSDDVYRLDSLMSNKGGNLENIIAAKYGKPYADALMSYLKTLAGQNDGQKLTEFERIYNSLIGNSAFSVLAFNAMSCLKQFVSLIFAGTQGEVKFTDIIKACSHLGVDDAVFEMYAPEIINSGFNYEIDKHIADKVKKFGYAQRNKLKQIGMAHIEKADMMTKKLVWWAMYDKALSQGMNIQDASVKATDLVKRTMSVSNPENLSQLQRNKNPFMRLTFMFTTDLFQMWNAIWFGIPNDFKNGNKGKAFEKIVGLTLTATALALAKGGFLPDDDDEGFIDFNQLVKDIIGESIQMTPGIGGALQSAWDGWNGSLVTTFEKAIGLVKLPLRKTPATGYDYADRFLDLVVSIAGAGGMPSLAFNRAMKIVLPEGIKEEGIDLDLRNMGYILNDNFGDFLNTL